MDEINDKIEELLREVKTMRGEVKEVKDYLDYVHKKINKALNIENSDRNIYPPAQPGGESAGNQQ